MFSNLDIYCFFLVFYDNMFNIFLDCVWRGVGGYLGLPSVFQSDNLSIHEVTLLQPSSCTAVNIDWEPPPGIWLWNMRNEGGREKGDEREGGRAERERGREMKRKIDWKSLKRLLFMWRIIVKYCSCTVVAVTPFCGKAVGGQRFLTITFIT